MDKSHPHSVKTAKYSANTRCYDNNEVHPNTVFKVVAFLSSPCLTIAPNNRRRRVGRKEKVQEDQRGGGGWGGEGRQKRGRGRGRRGGSREGGEGEGEEYEEVVTASGYKTLS